MANEFKAEPAGLRRVAQGLAEMSSRMGAAVSPVRAQIDSAGLDACSMKLGDCDKLLEQIRYVVTSVHPYKTELVNGLSDRVQQTANDTAAADEG